SRGARSLTRLSADPVQAIGHSLRSGLMCSGLAVLWRGESTGLTSGRRRLLQLLQAASSLIQCGVGLTEAETPLLAAEGRIAVETAAGNRSHPDLLDKVPGEADVIRKPKSGDVRHHIVGASRLEATEASLLQRGQHAVPPGEV